MKAVEPGFSPCVSHRSTSIYSLLSCFRKSNIVIKWLVRCSCGTSQETCHCDLKLDSNEASLLSYTDQLMVQLFEDNKLAATRDFQQFGILTSVDSDEPVQPPFKPRNSK